MFCERKNSQVKSKKGKYLEMSNLKEKWLINHKEKSKQNCNKVRKKEGSGQGWPVKTRVIYWTDKLKHVRTLRLLGTSTLSVVSVFVLAVPITDHAPESTLRLSPRVPAPRWLYWVSPRQLLQSDTGVPHFALDPLTYRCLLSLSPAADFAEPRPPRHKNQCIKPSFFTNIIYLQLSLIQANL